MSEARTSEELRAALHTARTQPESPPQVYGPFRTPQERLGAELAVTADRQVAIRDLEAELARNPAGESPATGRTADVAECAQCAQLDDALGSTIDERDRLAELLDEMTAAVASVLYRDFGEHSSANDPWRNAIRALKGLEA
ncbi:hypothetical protein [Nocardia brasiliensis]|uniref:hypothetical protein n=1 Tax=Nocardia brasiliensis TaxID=37326 RepID=UPI0024542F8C|nr:hypothetical protein [Nocardia brasiliensis]